MPHREGGWGAGGWWYRQQGYGETLWLESKWLSQPCAQSSMFVAPAIDCFNRVQSVTDPERGHPGDLVLSHGCTCRDLVLSDMCVDIQSPTNWALVTLNHQTHAL